MGLKANVPVVQTIQRSRDEIDHSRSPSVPSGDRMFLHLLHDSALNDLGQVLVLR
jgi:hypothetical protein